MTAVVVFMASLAAVYKLATWYGVNAPYEIGKYLGVVFMAVLVVAFAGKLLKHSAEGARLTLVALLVGGLAYGLGLYRDVRQARAVIDAALPASEVDPAEIGTETHGRYAPVLRWNLERTREFQDLVSEIGQEAGSFDIPPVFDAAAMADANNIGTHRATLVSYQRFAGSAWERMRGKLDEIEQEGERRFPDLLREMKIPEQSGFAVARQYWGAYWEAELEFVSAALELLTLLESHEYSVDANSGLYLFSDDAANRQFQSLIRSAQLAIESQAEAQRQMEKRLREVGSKRPDWAQ